MNTIGPRAPDDARVPNPQSEEVGAANPGTSPAWASVVEMWGTPELFIQDLLRTMDEVRESGDSHYYQYLYHPLGSRFLLEDVLRGHPFPRR